MRSSIDDISLILVVEDEPDILDLVQYHLEKAGYEVVAAVTGEDAVRTVRQEPPDLIVLDLMLPGIDGLDVCRIMKDDGRTESIPIVMLTAKGEESDIVKGLELGADDYVTKPFSPKVLVARVNAVLRRQKSVEVGKEDVISVAELVIHPGRREVRVAHKPTDLTFSEFEILHLLARRPGWVYTRNQIIDAVHGHDHPVTDRSVDFQMVGLRKKLRQAGELIKTVRGVGYRFQAEES